jgi:Zinc finger, ZZ type
MPDDSMDDKDEEGTEGGENSNVLHLLYTIAQVFPLTGRRAQSKDQAHQDGFVHRGISCNKCHEEPIRGVRYHCLNCIDYDLCEYCEAEDAHFRHHTLRNQVNDRTHTMIKIRVPTPSLVRRRPTELPMYPGKHPHIPSIVLSIDRQDGC